MYQLPKMRSLHLRYYYISRQWFIIGFIVVFVLGTFLIRNRHYHSHRLPELDSSRQVPLLYWYHRTTYPLPYKNPNCTRAPSPRKIKHLYPYWQYIKNPKSNVIASSAFWDDRFSLSAVRILVYSDIKKLDNFLCQLWYFNKKDPIIVHAQDIYAWRDEDINGEYEDYVDDIVKQGPAETIVQPHILTCTVPIDSGAPAAVSLVTDQCAGATNLLKVQGAPIGDDVKAQLPGVWTEGERVRNVLGPKGVCVCAFVPSHNRDVSARVAEWLELLRHFDVDMIYLYMTVAHPNVRHVINHYQWLGLVEVSYFSMPFADDWFKNQIQQPSQGTYGVSYRKRQQVIYNDCLYRSIGWHRWIVPLRLDDLIVPNRDGTLVKLAKRELEQSPEEPDSLSFSAFRFYPRESEPAGLKMVEHQWRLNESFIDDYNVRSMNSIDTMIVLQEHLPLWCAGGTIRLSDGNVADRDQNKHLCHVHKVDADAARVHAYGSVCKGCGELVRDTRMQRWQDVAEETDYMLKQLPNNER